VPIYGIHGSAIAAVIAFGAACYLNLRDLRRSTQTGLTFAHLKRPMIAIVIMCAVLWGSIEGLDWLFTHSHIHFSYRLTETLVVLISILLAAIVYFVVLLRLGAVTRQDLLLIPGFETKILRLFKRG
jgi:polysaccharide transporter, PST family